MTGALDKANYVAADLRAKAESMRRAAEAAGGTAWETGDGRLILEGPGPALRDLRRALAFDAAADVMAGAAPKGGAA